MEFSPTSLRFVYNGWDGYNRALVLATGPLTQDQLAFRVGSDMRAVGELIWHIASGRVDWFKRIDAPGSSELERQIAERNASGEVLTAPELVDWLNRTWKMVEATLDQWTVDDLSVTFRHPYQGKTYAVSRQWVIWRILLHDVHHGGQLSEVLAAEGIEPLELTWLGGHLTEPDVVE